MLRTSRARILSAMRSPAAIPFTADGFAEVKKQHEHYLSERPAAVENLRKSREMGDLSENGYYKASRQRLSFIDGRIRHFYKLLKLGRIVQTAANGTVQIGSKVRVKGSAAERTFTIVGGYESNPNEEKISHISPIGRALMGKRTGDRVSVPVPSGNVEYTVLSVQ